MQDSLSQDIVSGFSASASPVADADSLTLLSDRNGSTCLLYSLQQAGRRLLMKRLRPEYLHDVRMREIFQKEYATGRRIQSPYLVEYVSLEEDHDGPYILMEYVDGRIMAETLAEQPEWFAQDDHLLRFFDQLLQGIQALHLHQVLHLDLKPDNIMLTRVSADVKVIDLGYCYSDTYYNSTGRNRTYAAPEQLDGSRQPDVRTDLYAIGRMISDVCERTGMKVSRRLQEVIDRSTQANPDLRYDSAQHMREALLHALSPSTRRNKPLFLSMGGQ